MQISLEQLKSLLETLEKGDVSEFEYEDEQLKLRLSLGKQAPQVVHAAPPAIVASPAATAAATAAAAKASDDADPNVVFITSPFVGTFYRAPSPDTANFCEVGSTVKQGQTLCIIEAMKLMNEIESDCDGEIASVYVENGKAVQFGERLFAVKVG